MKSRWSDTEAARCAGDAELRVYTSRLLGAEPSLVLHGGGNTSVKLRQKNVLGEEEEILFVKGSGWDLATIEAAGFAPVKLSHLQRLAELEELSDPAMVNEMLTHMTRSDAPSPSVEAILHAILPYRFVDHTHADAIVTITNSVDGAKRIQEIYDNTVVVIPYVMPGFDLARVCAERFAREATESTVGMVLLNHGIFSFGETAKESYERMISLVSQAEDYLKAHQAWDLPSVAIAEPNVPSRDDIARLRRAISQAAGFPMILRRTSKARARAFAARPDVESIATRGPATPDHVIRTKRIPMIGRDVARYAADYQEFFSRHAKGKHERATMLDPAPRVVLDGELGLLTAGRTAQDASVASEIYEHTIEIIDRATALGGYEALPESDLFDVEYWDLEQAKLTRAGKPKVFAGEVAMITGAASGIGRACVDSFLQRGAAVVALDINPAVTDLLTRPDYTGIRCDVTDMEQLTKAFDGAVGAYGGLDMLVLNAGIFPAGQRIVGIDSEEWRRVMTINLDANLAAMQLAQPLLELAPRSGRVAILGSKNVPAPGPGAGAYSASKAALTQLARVAALEWGQYGIRVNSLHPHGVFDTSIWTDEVLASRAGHYGMTIEQYRRNNVLGVEVTSKDVAELAAELCGPLFARSTGLQIPIDGGSDRVI
jgi:rhamnose utilization protein RhaD (predicted bifunctional aldolase and dehydrogenase)/NAD(P)-dependent dehydrogenase (short-subunit alcohol dehydrogenase family)